MGAHITSWSVKRVGLSSHTKIGTPAVPPTHAVTVYVTDSEEIGDPLLRQVILLSYLIIHILIFIMGTKFSKSSSAVNGKLLTANETPSKKLNEIESSSTLSNSTDSSSNESRPLPRHFERSRSLSKRFRKSCRNWAVGRGLVEEKKPEISSKKDEETPNEKNNSKVSEDNDLTLIDLEENPETTKYTKDVDIGSIVAELVLDAQKRKNLSNAQSEMSINLSEIT